MDGMNKEYLPLLNISMHKWEGTNNDKNDLESRLFTLDRCFPDD